MTRDRAEMKTKRPAQGAQPHLATVKPGPQSRFHDQIDTMGLGSAADTHGVDLIMKASGWRAVPDPGRTPVAYTQILG
jgi:hypothetical protein